MEPYFKAAGGRKDVYRTPRLRQLYGLEPYEAETLAVPAEPAPLSDAVPASEAPRVLLGVGCFWYAQHLLEPAPGEAAFAGVLSAEAGYAGPGPEEACGCSAAEVVAVRYAVDAAGARPPSSASAAADPLRRQLQDAWDAAPAAPVLRRLLRLFWTCQDHRDPAGRATEGYVVQIIVFGEAQVAEAEASRDAFEQDLRLHFADDRRVAHVKIVDGVAPGAVYTPAAERQQHWFFKGELDDADYLVKDGQTKIGKAGLAEGLLGEPMPTPTLDAWVAAGVVTRTASPAVDGNCFLPPSRTQETTATRAGGGNGVHT